MKNPTEELTGIFSSLRSWDISLALNMTYRKRVGYFADAQYDGKSPIVGIADTSPEGGSKKTRHSERSEESHRVSEQTIHRALFRWDISLTLNMTYYFYYTSFCQCRASKLACKGLRATIFIRRKHFAKMQKTKVLMRQHCAPYIRSEESY